MEKNKRAPAAAKAEERYLLTTKLFCGKCGRMMVGECGTSRAGLKHYYYKCGSAKRKTGCDKKAVRKQWIEDLVVEHTMRMILNDTVVSDVAALVVTEQDRENTDLPALQNQLAQTERGIENLLNAIQQGIFTASTKQRLDELEAAKEELTVRILQEQIAKPRMTEEEVRFWICRFRELDTTKEEHRQRLIDSFVNAVYVYDDKLVLTYSLFGGEPSCAARRVPEGQDGVDPLIYRVWICLGGVEAGVCVAVGCAVLMFQAVCDFTGQGIPVVRRTEADPRAFAVIVLIQLDRGRLILRTDWSESRKCRQRQRTYCEQRAQQQCAKSFSSHHASS